MKLEPTNQIKHGNAGNEAEDPPPSRGTWHEPQSILPASPAYGHHDSWPRPDGARPDSQLLQPVLRVTASPGFPVPNGPFVAQRVLAFYDTNGNRLLDPKFGRDDEPFPFGQPPVDAFPGRRMGSGSVLSKVNDQRY